MLYAWYEKHQTVAPKELVPSWDRFVFVWLRYVTTEEMAVVNRSLEIVVGDGASWTPWPLNSKSPVDVRVLPPPVSIPIRESGEMKFEILDVMGVHRRWLALPSPRPVHPLVAVIDVRQSTPDEALISHVKDMTRLPYVASEVLRRSWHQSRKVTDVNVDGKPLEDFLSIIFGPIDRWLYVDSPTRVNSRGGLRLDENGSIFPQDARKRMLPMVAWPEYRGSLRQDLWLLLTVVYGSTKAIVWTEEDGARLLARNVGGGFRRFSAADIRRWRELIVYADSIEIWRGGSRFVKVVYIYHLSPGRVSIDKPTWYSEAQGRFTLTGTIHRARYVGGRRSYSRAIGCMEYWLARSYDGTPGIASLLRPESGNTGPGPWALAPSGSTDWWEWYEVLAVLMLEGVNRTNSKARAVAQRRYWRIVEGLRAAGYLRHGAAGNGDVVEVETSAKRRGASPALRFRATARFCEAAQLAQDRAWSTVPLFEWVGKSDSPAVVKDAEIKDRQELRERRKALTIETVEETLRRCNNNMAKAERELDVGGAEPGNYLRGWLRKHRAGHQPRRLLQDQPRHRSL